MLLSMQAAMDRLTKAAKVQADATEAVNDLKAKLDKAKEELDEAKKNYAEEWRAVRELAAFHAWTDLTELAAVGASILSASQGLHTVRHEHHQLAAFTDIHLVDDRVC